MHARGFLSALHSASVFSRIDSPSDSAVIQYRFKYPRIAAFFCESAMNRFKRDDSVVIHIPLNRFKRDDSEMIQIPLNRFKYF